MRWFFLQTQGMGFISLQKISLCRQLGWICTRRFSILGHMNFPKPQVMQKGLMLLSPVVLSQEGLSPALLLIFVQTHQVILDV